MSMIKGPGVVGQVCSVHKAWRPSGIFFGENPLTFSTPVLLAQLSLCALVNGTLQFILTPLGESAFTSQILTGIIMGPSLLGSNHIFKDLIFPTQSFYVCDTFAYFGLMLFLFLVGVKMDLKLLRESGRRAVVIGLATFLMPLILNFVIGEILIHSMPLETRLYRSILWVSSFQSLSSFHVIFCLLTDLKLVNSELGRLALSSSMISGACSWFWTFFVFTGKQTVGYKYPGAMVLMFLSVAGFMLFVFGLRSVFIWMAKTTINEKSVKESYISTIFILVLVCAIFGEVVGQHFLFGPMILGMSIPDGPPLGTALVNKLECFISTILLPVYFVVGVSRIDFGTIEPKSFGIIELMSLSASMCKMIGAVLPALYCKMPMTDAFCLGIILSTQGITDVLLVQRAMQLDLIDKQSYSIMILSMVLYGGVTSPIVKLLYKPFRRYVPYKRRTIQHARPNSELRILACIYHQDHTPSIINLLEASYPHQQNPICFYAIHLLELAGRAAPVLVAHCPGRRKNLKFSESERIINALRLYEQQNQSNVTVFPYTAIAPNETMHDDVCSLALEKRVSMVIVPFHKLWTMNLSMEEANAIRSVNLKILKRAPSSVGILIDRGTLSGHAPILPKRNLYSIGVIFLGGKDDREALAYGSRMAKHPNVTLTVVRFLEPKLGGKFSSDMEQDFDMLNELKEAHLKNEFFIYQEEEVKDSVGLISVIRKVENSFDLILVGRHHDSNLQLLVGLREWREFPEVGFIGDMLISTDSTCKVSVLIVQQHSFAGDDTVHSPRSVVDNSSAVVDMPWDTVKVSPFEKL